MRNVCLYKELRVNVLESRPRWVRWSGVRVRSDQDTHTRTAGETLKTHSCNDTISQPRIRGRILSPRHRGSRIRDGEKNTNREHDKRLKKRREANPWGCEEQENYAKNMNKAPKARRSYSWLINMLLFHLKLKCVIYLDVKMLSSVLA